MQVYHVCMSKIKVLGTFLLKTSKQASMLENVYFFCTLIYSGDKLLSAREQQSIHHGFGNCTLQHTIQNFDYPLSSNLLGIKT